MQLGDYKRFFNAAGFVLSLASIFFVFSKLSAYSDAIQLSAVGVTGWLLIGGLGIAYGAADVLLALAWRRVLRHLGVVSPLRRALRIYGISQIAKYLPGNVFHFAGRQAMGMARGLPGVELLKSTAIELIVISLSGSLFSVITLPLFFSWFPGSVAFCGFISMALFTFYCFRRYFSTHLSVAFCLHTLFLIISGLIFWIISAFFFTMSGHVPLTWVYLTSAYVLAWLVGLVTPGAPAGIGIREMVLLWTLHGMLSEADLLMAVMLSRIVTVLGDVLFYFFALFTEHE